MKFLLVLTTLSILLLVPLVITSVVIQPSEESKIEFILDSVLDEKYSRKLYRSCFGADLARKMHNEEGIAREIATAECQFWEYNFLIIGQSYHGTNDSRGTDSTQLEAEDYSVKDTSKMNRKTRDDVCVMIELGYLDENLEPNFKSITDKIENLPVGENLKRDIQDGVIFCRKFSQSTPDDEENSTSTMPKELIRSMNFFRCYNNMRLKACINKSIREKNAVLAENSDGSLNKFKLNFRP